MKRITNRLVKLLQEYELKVAFAESMTCGLAAHQLSTVKGTSEVLLGSIVCYHPDVKTCVLGVKQSLIDRYSAESQEVTDELVRRLPRVMKADLYVAVTGLASPGGSQSGEPAGTVFISAASGSKKIFREKKRFRGSPLEIKKKACAAMYRLLIDVILETKKESGEEKNKKPRRKAGAV